MAIPILTITTAVGVMNVRRAIAFTNCPGLKPESWLGLTITMKDTEHIAGTLTTAVGARRVEKQTGFMRLTTDYERGRSQKRKQRN
jgi:hypothetical protein